MPHAKPNRGAGLRTYPLKLWMSNKSAQNALDLQREASVHPVV